jgi:hypothetical protein
MTDEERQEIKQLVVDFLNNKIKPSDIPRGRKRYYVMNILSKMKKFDHVDLLCEDIRECFKNDNLVECGWLGWLPVKDVPFMGIAQKYDKWVVTDPARFVNYGK